MTASTRGGGCPFLVPSESGPEIFRITAPWVERVDRNALGGFSNALGSTRSTMEREVSGNVPEVWFARDKQRAARRWVALRESGLLAQTELLQQVVVFGQVFALDVIKQFATTAGHLEETAAAVEILAMRAQVLGQVIDPGREQRDLDVAGAGVGLVSFVGGDYF